MAYQKSLHIEKVDGRIQKDTKMRAVDPIEMLPDVFNVLFLNLLIMDASSQTNRVTICFEGKNND
jgi:hypothetical protein